MSNHSSLTSLRIFTRSAGMNAEREGQGEWSARRVTSRSERQTSHTTAEPSTTSTSALLPPPAPPAGLFPLEGVREASAEVSSAGRFRAG